jgi:hypothetical protein
MTRTTRAIVLTVMLAWAATVAAQSATILGISPLSPGVSSGEQILSVGGGGFRPGLSLVLTTPAGGSVTVSGADILSVVGSSVRARVVLAVAGAWRVRVTNAGSKASNEWRFIVRPGAAVSPVTAKPGGGGYTVAQKVALSCPTLGSTIRYTTDGSEPTTSSAAYGAPIALGSTTTIKALAVKAGMSDSPVTIAVYTFSLPQVAAPVARPPGGTYSIAQIVTLTSATAGATIRYTTNGSQPTSESTVYSGAIPLPATATIKARAFRAGMADSGVATATYAIRQAVAAPVANPGSGCFLAPPVVTLATTTAGATIRFTTNGTSPSEASPAYTASIHVPSNTTIKAQAFKGGMTNSAVMTAAYTVLQPVATPVAKPAAGNYATGQYVTLTTATKGATIRYTANGSDPTIAAAAYTAPVPVTATTLKARGFKSGMTDSAVATFAYVVPDTDFLDIESKDRKNYHYETKNGSLFSTTWKVPRPNDVFQGRIGDCYFLSSLAAIANSQSSLLQRAIADKGNGVYEVTLYDANGTAQKQLVDSRIPVDKTGWNLGAAGPPLWVALIEKAYAQSRGSYGNIEGGFGYQAMQTLTGKSSQFYSVTKESCSKSYGADNCVNAKSMSMSDIEKWVSKGYAVTSSSLDKGEAKHLPLFDGSGKQTVYADHEYFVTAVDTKNKTVTLHNPWGWNQGTLTLSYDDYQKAFAAASVNTLGK